MTDISEIITRMDSIEKRLSFMEVEVLVSCSEAARLLGRTTVTISRMIKDGRLNKTTIGGSTGIRLSEIRKINAQ